VKAMNNRQGKSLHKVAILFVVMLACSLVFFQTNFVSASMETVVKVEPYLSFASIGETFTVNVTIFNVQNLYGVEITLYWNESILQLTEVDVRLNVNKSHPDGVLYDPVYWTNEISSNKYFLWGTSYEPAPPFYGSGNIVKLTFTVMTVGNCTLHLESKLADWPPPYRIPRVSKPIDHTTLDGVFVIPEFSALIILIPFQIFLILIVILTKISKKKRIQ